MILYSQKILLIIICISSVIVGLFILYETYKRPSKKSDSYDANLLSKIRGIGLIVIGLFVLLLLYYRK